MMAKPYLSFLILFLGLINISANNGISAHLNSSQNDRIIRPTRTTNLVKIDGFLDEEIWQQKALCTNFITYQPTRGDTLPMPTRIWLTYDDENLYFAIHCHDSEPAKIKTSISQRDRIFADDWVGLSLDALQNQQSSIEFIVNPNGIQADILHSNVIDEDVAPDYVWESAGQLVRDGYQVEIRIPLRTIRFQAGKEVKMGILFFRKISRLGMSGAWPEIKPGEGFFTQHATVIYNKIKSPRMLEVLPSLTYNRNTKRETPTQWNKTEVNTDFGIGLKYGLTSSITAELTHNPDFSQVESDVFQMEVNRRYPNFYQEKRPFFMEGLDILNLAIIPHGYMMTAVHTRHIVDPQWGAKLTGTIDKTSFGLLTAGDEFPGYEWEDEEEKNLHPGKTATFLIARSKRSFGNDNYMGALYSGREFANGYNHVVGTDAHYRFFKNQQITGSIMQSFNRNPEDQTFNSGNAINFTHAYETRKLSLMYAFQHFDSNFNMETAFLSRTGMTTGWIYIGPSFYPTTRKLNWLKRFTPQFIYSHLYDLSSQLNDVFLSFLLEFHFSRQSYIMPELTWETESWEGIIFEKKIFNLFGQSQFTKWLGIEMVLGRQDRIYYDGEPAYLGLSYSARIELNLQPNSKFNQNFAGYYENFTRHTDNARIYEVTILNTRTTYQFNKYLFFRATLRYDSYEKKFLTDLLASFTLIPGTVLHLGYGTIHERRHWQNNKWLEKAGKFYEMRRGLFFKASYLWRG